MSWKKQGGSDRLPKAENIKTNNLVTNNLVTNNLASNSFQFTESGYVETTGTGTTYGNGNGSKCPQLLIVGGHVNIYFDSIEPGKIYHAFWKSGGGAGQLRFYNNSNILQKTFKQSAINQADGGLIFIHDLDDYYSFGILGGLASNGSDLQTTGYAIS